MLRQYAVNPFEKSRLSDKDFAQFSNLHLKFMEAGNADNKFTPMIVRLSPAHEAFQTWLGTQDQNLTARKGKTKTVDTIIKEFSDFVKSELNKEVSYRFKTDFPEKFNEFYPNGLTEYSNITKKEAKILFDRIATAATKFSAELPAKLVQTASDLNVEFKSERDIQLSKKGTVKDTSTDGDGLRKELAKVLFINWLEQLQNNVDNPNTVLSYYDAQYLNSDLKPRKGNGDNPA